MLGKLLNAATNLANEGVRLFNRAIDEGLFNRVVYTGYLIASADGDFDADERKALVTLIHKDLPDFSTEDIVEAIRKCETKVAFDETLGIQEILDEIAKSSDNPEDAKQIMKVCAFIGKADGDYDRSEQVMARRICKALKLNTEDYGI